MNTWNNTFSMMREHALGGIKFLLGDVATSSNFSTESPGFLLRLRGKHESSIKITDNDTKITDNWHRTAFGFAGRGVEAEGAKPLMIEATAPLTAELFKAICVPLYTDTNMRYFDLCAQSYIEVAEKWQDALVKCDSRLPVSPPKGNPQVVAGEIPKKQHGRQGYSKKTTIQYAVSYVSGQGEGFLGALSEALSPSEDGVGLELTLEPVTLSNNAFAGLDMVRESAGNRAKSGNIGEAMVSFLSFYYPRPRPRFFVATVRVLCP